MGSPNASLNGAGAQPVPQINNPVIAPKPPIQAPTTMGAFGGGPSAPSPANFGAPMDRNMQIAGRNQRIPRNFIYGPGQQGPFGG